MNNKKLLLIILVLVLPLVSAIGGVIGNSNININGVVNENYQNYVLVRNSNDFPVNITLSATGDIVDKIKFNETKFILQSQEENKAYFNISSDQAGTFNGNIRIRFEGNGTSITLSSIVNFIVRENGSENNEPIALITPMLDSQAIAGKNLIMRATIKNLQSQRSAFVISTDNYQSWALLTNISEPSFELEPNESKNVIFTFKVNENTEGNKSLSIRVISGDKIETKDFSVLISNTTSNQLIANVGDTNLTVSGFVGDVINKTILVKNVNNVSVNISLTTQDNDLIITDSSFVLQPGEEKQARFSGKINQLGKTQKKITVLFNADGRESKEANINIFIVGQQRLRADVVYIVRNLNGVDHDLLQQLSSLRYTYETLEEMQVSQVNLNEYRIIIIGNQDLSDPASIPIEKHKTLIINSYDYYKMSNGNFQLGWAGAKSSTTNPQMKVININSPITLGIPEQFNSYTITSGQNVILKGQKPTGTDIVVSSASQSSDATIASLDKGKKLLNGKTLEEREIFFGITQAQHWTSETKTLFKNSLNWLLIGEDRDGDGYYSDVDCNDNNVLVNPGSSEIPYDGIDNDCSGGDLVDADKDGYNAMIVGGNDCNDNNALINPASLDTRLNCRNDAPVVNDIQKITVSETERAIIIVNANDPENNNLTYSINDIRFANVGNTFVWETTLEDEGEHNFTVTVSDGEFNINKNAEVKITKFDRAPLLFKEAPEITWGEDKYAKIDLYDYFIDEDGDNMTFDINDTSNDKYIKADYLGNGIFNFSSEPNWNGDYWIVFSASDGEKTTNSNRINLKVIPINDPVLFEGNITDLEWNEDTNLTNAINLYNYFVDVDNPKLNFGVIGESDNIDITISENGLVSFYPKKDFNGEEEISFTANDSEFSAISYKIKLIVRDTGEPPVLKDWECLSEIEEDQTYNCTLFAEDFENDNLTFSTRSDNNLICSVNENVLTYKPKKDYNGLASCEVVVSDKDGSDSKKLNVNVSAMNDAPEIVSYIPIGDSAIIIQGKNREFKINVKDADSSTIISWFVNGELKTSNTGSSSSYLFSGEPGLYLLESKVSDSLLNAEKIWSVTVGPTSDFTCSEVEGFALSDKEICSGELINVSDSNSCCSIKGVPSFKNVDICKITNSSVVIDINDPSESDKLILGSEFIIKFDIDNQLDKKQNFDVKVYLYNLDKSKSENSVDAKVRVDTDRTVRTNLNLNIPNDIDESDNYAIFIRAKDDVCSQAYQEISLERKAEDIKITDFNIPDSANCGEDVNVKVRTQNFGTDDENIKIKIENSKLKIEEETESFKLEEFNQHDVKSGNIALSIPKDAEPGRYELTVSVIYNGKVDSLKKNIKIECAKNDLIQRETNATTNFIQVNNRIKLNSVNYEDNQDQVKKPGIGSVISLTVLNFMLIFSIFILVSVWKKKREERNMEILRTRVFIDEKELEKKEIGKKVKRK